MNGWDARVREHVELFFLLVAVILPFLQCSAKLSAHL